MQEQQQETRHGLTGTNVLNEKDPKTVDLENGGQNVDNFSTSYGGDKKESIEGPQKQPSSGKKVLVIVLVVVFGTLLLVLLCVVAWVWWLSKLLFPPNSVAKIASGSSSRHGNLHLSQGLVASDSTSAQDINSNLPSQVITQPMEKTSSNSDSSDTMVDDAPQPNSNNEQKAKSKPLKQQQQQNRSRIKKISEQKRQEKGNADLKEKKSEKAKIEQTKPPEWQVKSDLEQRAKTQEKAEKKGDKEKVVKEKPLSNETENAALKEKKQQSQEQEQQKSEQPQPVWPPKPVLEKKKQPTEKLFQNEEKKQQREDQVKETKGPSPLNQERLKSKNQSKNTVVQKEKVSAITKELKFSPDFLKQRPDYIPFTRHENSVSKTEREEEEEATEEDPDPEIPIPGWKDSEDKLATSIHDFLKKLSTQESNEKHKHIQPTHYKRVLANLFENRKSENTYIQWKDRVLPEKSVPQGMNLCSVMIDMISELGTKLDVHDALALFQSTKRAISGAAEAVSDYNAKIEKLKLTAHNKLPNYKDYRDKLIKALANHDDMGLVAMKPGGPSVFKEAATKVMKQASAAKAFKEAASEETSESSSSKDLAHLKKAKMARKKKKPITKKEFKNPLSNKSTSVSPT